MLKKSENFTKWYVTCTYTVLTSMEDTKLNIFKEFKDKIKPENNQKTKINQTNKLGYQKVMKPIYIYTFIN